MRTIDACITTRRRGRELHRGQREQFDDPNDSTVEPSPYVGIQFAAIPEFAGIATEVSQEFSAAYAGQQTVAEALARAQAITNEAMEAAGYR